MRTTKFLKSLTAMLLVLTMVCGLFSCNSAPSQETFEKAYESEIDVAVDEIGKLYDRVDDYDFQNMSVDAKLSVDFSEDLLYFLRSSTSYDWEWLNDAKLTLSENSKNDMVSVELGLEHGKTDLIDAEMIMNLTSGDIFMAIPVLNDLILKQEGVLTKSSDVPLDTLMGIDFKKILPDEDLLEKVIKKIYSAMMDCVDEVSFKDKTLKVNGVQESCIEYEVELTQKNLMEILVNVLDLLAEDEDFETLIVDFVDNYNQMAEDAEMDDLGTTSTKVYKDITQYINSMVDKIEATLEADDGTEDEVVLIWSSYISGKLDIIGTEIEVVIGDETSTFFMAGATDDNDVGVEVYFENGDDKLFEIVGELVDNGKKLSGSYELSVRGESMLFVDLEDVSVKKLEDGYFVGSMIVSPSKGLNDIIVNNSNIDFDVAGIAISNLALKLDVEKNDAKNAKMSLSVINGNEPYATVNFEASIGGGKKLRDPKKATDNIDEWAENIDTKELSKRVEKCDLPGYVKEWIELIDSSIK